MTGLATVQLDNGQSTGFTSLGNIGNTQKYASSTMADKRSESNVQNHNNAKQREFYSETTQTASTKVVKESTITTTTTVSPVMLS